MKDRIENQPNYKKIYQDIIKKKMPHKEKLCRDILAKDTLEILDVIKLNSLLFGTKNISQKHKAYDEKTVREILSHQKKENLSNIQLARLYSLSRNTITRWKKIWKV